MTKSFSNFADLASFIASEIDSHDRATTYEHAFIEHDERAKLSPVDEAEQLDMPDPEQARVAVEMVMSTLFDVFRDTRLEPYAADLAWGFVNSFHVVAKRINDREDDAAKELGELARSFDPSEIYAAQLEDAQLLCQTLQGCRDAMECMRDHASEVYRVETGRPYSPTRGSRVSRVDHVERRIEQLVGRGQLIAGEARIGDTHPRMVTTREALLTEERILGAVEEGRGLASPILAAQDAPGRLQAVADRELNAGQLGAAALILSSEDRTVAIQGIAGAGKSTMLQAVARVAEAEARAVMGLAFQNKMVADLAEGAGTRCCRGSTLPTRSTCTWRNRNGAARWQARASGRAAPPPAVAGTGSERSCDPLR